VHLFGGLESGERADDQQRLIAEGCLSCRSDLIPFKDTQQEAWKGIFQRQRVHCWDAEMQRGLGSEGWGDALLSNSSQITWISSGGTYTSFRGQGAASFIAERGVWVRSRGAHVFRRNTCCRIWERLGGGGRGGTFVPFFCLQYISGVFYPIIKKNSAHPFCSHWT